MRFEPTLVQEAFSTYGTLEMLKADLVSSQMLRQTMGSGELHRAEMAGTGSSGGFRLFVNSTVEREDGPVRIGLLAGVALERTFVRVHGLLVDFEALQPRVRFRAQPAAVGSFSGVHPDVRYQALLFPEVQVADVAFVRQLAGVSKKCAFQSPSSE